MSTQAPTINATTESVGLREEIADLEQQLIVANNDFYVMSNARDEEECKRKNAEKERDEMKEMIGGLLKQAKIVDVFKDVALGGEEGKMTRDVVAAVVELGQMVEALEKLL